jgi:hypothetical protein
MPVPEPAPSSATAEGGKVARIITVEGVIVWATLSQPRGSVPLAGDTTWVAGVDGRDDGSGVGVGGVAQAPSKIGTTSHSTNRGRRDMVHLL